MGRPTNEERRLRDAAIAEAQITGSDPTTSVEVAETHTAHMKNPDVRGSAHGETDGPHQSGGKVIVACKIDVRAVQLQLCELIDVEQQTQTGMRLVKEPRRTGKVIVIRGTAYPRGTVPDGFPEKPVIVNGAALNFDIDEDFWNEWYKQNRRNPLVENGLIFAHARQDYIRALAEDRSGIQSGLQPIDPKGDVRVEKSRMPNTLSNIETAPR